MTTGQRIRSARERAGLTQVELAAKMGVSNHCISKWETDFRNPKYGTLVRIAGALAVPLSKLLGDPAEVTRCKNCAMFNGIRCAHWGAKVVPDDYCSRGMRRVCDG